MGDGRSILDNQHTSGAHRFGVVQLYQRGAAHQVRARVDPVRGFAHLLHIGVRGRVHFRHQHNVGHAQHGFAGVVAGLMAGPQRVDQHDVQVRPDERKVVVASVPENNVGFG